MPLNILSTLTWPRLPAPYNSIMPSSSTALTPEEQAEEDAWAEAWQEADMEEGGARVVEGMVLQLPHEILCRILSFLSHAALVNTVFRVNVRLSQASAFEARTRTQNRLLEALLSGFGTAADRPRLLTLATSLEKALACAGSARYPASARKLVFNLKDPKNPDLRARLLSGSLDSAGLLRLCEQPQQLAGSELQQQRSEWRRKGKLRAMRPQCSSGYETDLYRCDNCGASSTKVHRSIRAGRTHVDRATTWATCTGCRHRWEV